MFSPSLPGGPGDMGTMGSGGAVLTGQVAAANIGYHDGQQHMAESERLREARLRVEKAIKEKKIFAVQGPYPVIRRLLRARGWVERKLPRKKDEDKEDKEQCREDSDDIHDLMSFLVQDQVPNFLWTIRLGNIDQELLPRIEVVNRFPRLNALCTKEGLCQSLQNLPWFEEVDLNTFFPRCYRLGLMGEQEAFIGEPGVIALRSSTLPMPYAGLAGVTLPSCRGFPPDGRSSHVSHPTPSTARLCSPPYPQLVEEALEVCEQHLGVLEHQDIDRDTLSPCRTCIAWDRFLREYYRVGSRLILSKEQQEQCQDVLRRLEEQLPQLRIEGKLNVWILKPSAKSRGRGIVCTTRLEEVLKLSQSCAGSSARVCEWVVQKYVERPLTIFDTKFDIRQWFVVTDWNPLTAWFYRDCYLRFCSRPFSLCHLEPARHLCNVAIQKRYKTLQPDPRVPPDKIWSNAQFQAHLAQLGRADAWKRVIVPGMKAAIRNALRCARDHVGSRKGSFELFGADFLIGKDFQPWLLEINSCPTMSPSSLVTRQLCANVQRDTLRLVLDRKDNPTCSIGAFELLYREVVTSNPWQPLGGSAGSQELPWLLHLVGEPEDAQPQEAHSQESWPKATLSPFNSRPQDRFPPLQEVRGRALLPPGSCASSQGLPQLSQPGGQPQAARPHAVLPLINAHSPVRGPVSQALRAPSRPWRPSGCVPAPAGLPARPVRLSALYQSTGTPSPCLGQKHMPAPKRMQKTWDAETLP
uniref:Tubulin monoglycylase TTLL3-like n=1 Tax=Cyanoderma ruficeps TaxID=181631 RepID=A0A8C3NY28_9PASS